LQFDFRRRRLTANKRLMKKTGIVLCILAVAASFSCQAQDYKMALGVRFSNKAPVINNSISFKYFFTEKTAAEALFSFGDPLALGLLVEQHKPLLTNHFNYFYGGGVYAGFSGTRTVGFQGVLGLDYKIPLIPFNLSLDWKPELNVSKEFSFEPAALGLSARFTFK
jgi:hypothetical protein